MIAEIFIAALCFAVVVAFLCGEQYGRRQNRRHRLEIRERHRSELRAQRPANLRDLAWHGTEPRS